MIRARLNARSWMGSTMRAMLAAVLLIGACGQAWAGPPFVTDDPEPVELHHWEVYLASQYANGLGGSAGTLPHIEINNGVAPNLQLHVILPVGFSSGGGGPFNYGYADTELGMKYRFLQETKSRPMVGIFPLVELPTGNASRGLGGGNTPVFLPIWIQKSWGKWTSYGGGGRWFNPGAGNRDYWLTGWLIQRELNEHLTLGGELFYTSPSVENGREQFNFNVGGQYNFDEGHHLLFSAGRSISGDTEFMSYVAYQWTFGPHGKAAAGAEEPGAATHPPAKAGK